MPANATDLDEARMIVATRILDAPRELVFDAWTDAKHIGNWWGPRGFTTTTHEMDVRPGGKWLFVMHGPDGTDYDNEVVYLEVVRPEKIVYTHGPAPVFDVVVTFEELGSKTRMTMRSIFGSAEIRNQVVEDFGAIDGMNGTLDRLEEEISKHQAFVISQAYPVPREQMFRLWTECEHLSHWWGPKGLAVFSCTNDLRVGGIMHYGMRSEDGQEVWGRWQYREVSAPDRIVFLSSFSDPERGVTHHPSAPEWPLQMLTTITFDERDGGTLVTVRWAPYHATDSQEATFDEGRDSMRGGWSGTFEKLGEYLAKMK